MNNNFRGWKAVYNFTFRQSTKGIGFKLVTTLITLLIIGIFVLVNILAAKPGDKEDSTPSPIETVMVLDQSGLLPTDFKSMNPELSSEPLGHIVFLTSTVQDRVETIKKAASHSTETVAAIITAVDEGFQIEFVIPEDSGIKTKDVEKLLQPVAAAFETNKMLQSGLSMEQLNSVLKPVVTSYHDIGENTNEITFAIKMIAPMIFGFMLYMMLLLYGQNVSKSVSTEKTSKLMETLLTSIHPYALILGKILAVTSMALIQFITWLIAGVIGLWGGNAIAHNIYPEYENTVVTIINYLKDNIGETAMTIPAVILAVLIFVVGFLFYCVLAGLAGSMVSKPEDVASTQAIFTFPIIISFLISYLAPAFQNEGLMKAARYIPFTIPFGVPSELITGTIGLGEGLLSLLLLTVFSFFVILLSARIYKGFVLYTGQNFSFKLIGDILKANK